eukprot:370737_1
MSDLQIKQHIVLCPSGHSMNDVSLEGLHSDSYTFECNMCRTAINHQHLPYIYMCEPCAYYLCAYCFKAIQSIQWRQQNDLKSRLISKENYVAKKQKSKKHFVKPFAADRDAISPIIVLNKIKLLDSKYWHKSVTFLIQIIEDALFNKSSHAKSIKEELREKKTKRSINYHKLYRKLYEYCNHHLFCRNELLNMLFHFGFRANGPALSEKTRLLWSEAEDQSRHPEMCGLYCELKNMIQQNYKINNIDDKDASSFYNELIECPMQFIIDRYTINANICTNVTDLIYRYTFNEYKVMKVRDCSSCSFVRYLQLLQDPKQLMLHHKPFDSVVMFIGQRAYVYANITPFERPIGFDRRYHKKRKKRKRRARRSNYDNVPSIRIW